jgi:hypothetical protein
MTVMIPMRIENRQSIQKEDGAEKLETRFYSLNLFTIVPGFSYQFFSANEEAAQKITIYSYILLRSTLQLDYKKDLCSTFPQIEVGISAVPG